MIGEQFVTTSKYADSQVDVDREVTMYVSTDAPVYAQIARINHRDGSRHWENADTPFPAADMVFEKCAGVRFKTNGATPANVFAVWTFHRDDAFIRRFSTNGPFNPVPGVITFNGRNGAVVPGNADYLAIASGGLPGAVAPTRYVGGTGSGSPATGTFAVGDFIIAEDGNVWVCTASGTPGTWTNAGSHGNLVTSVLGRTGAVVAVDGDYAGIVAAAKTGAVAATRYVGGTASGAPVSGTFQAGDFVVAQNGHVFICTVFGTPGTWVDAGSVGNLVTSVFGRTGAVVAADGDYAGIVAAAKTGAIAATRYVGATASGAPVSGTFAVGDFIVDQTGKIWVCTVAGTPGTWLPVSPGWSGTFDLVNSGALTALLSQSIPGNIMGANGALLVIVKGYYLQNSGAPRGLTLEVIFGGTTMWGDNSGATFFTATATRYPFYMQFLLANEGATNSQRVSGQVNIGTAVAGSVAGQGTLGSVALSVVTSFTGVAAVDTTSAKTLSVSAQHSAANASLELKGSVHIEVIP
jgi:hypothetical protein